jgi:hypothetical protein
MTERILVKVLPDQVTHQIDDQFESVGIPSNSKGGIGLTHPSTGINDNVQVTHHVTGDPSAGLGIIRFGQSFSSLTYFRRGIFGGPDNQVPICILADRLPCCSTRCCILPHMPRLSTLVSIRLSILSTSPHFKTRLDEYKSTKLSAKWSLFSIL